MIERMSRLKALSFGDDHHVIHLPQARATGEHLILLL